MAVKIEVIVFWVVPPCNVVMVRYQPRKWKQHGPPKRRYSTTTLHGATTQKTRTSFTEV
jgi:hypothetical protein